jgi:hypothetical protein
MDWPPSWFDSLVAWFEGLPVPDVMGWFDSADLNGAGVGMALLTTLVMFVSLFPKSPTSAMRDIPLMARILCVILIAPITYFITARMTR